MPHAVSMPAPGFQAVILCGPGVSFDTFTSRPEESPKALLPIANRPMVWYPLDFCYRMGVTDITIITPPTSATAISAALNTNPHLTSLPLPKPTLLAPNGLLQTTGTAQIFRLPEVRKAINGDFMVLPCDLVCELGGEALIETWMIKEAGLGGATGGGDEFTGPKMSTAGERGGRRGGLGVWYSTQGEPVVKGEETDFIATSPLDLGSVPPPKGSLLRNTSNLVYSVPTDSLNDITEEKKSLPVRHALIRQHPRVRMLSSHRDAHIYILPAWVLDMINSDDRMDNLSEDVIGWWAKAGWQAGLAEKLGLRKILNQSDAVHNQAAPVGTDYDEEVDVGSLSTTLVPRSIDNDEIPFQTAQQVSKAETGNAAQRDLVIPPILAYVHPVQPSAPLIRRVDRASLLLQVSLQLAKLDAVDPSDRATQSPYAHASKIAYPTGIATKTTVTRTDCLLADNVTVEEKCSIKECVIGARCHIGQGAKLHRCIVMAGVVVGKGCKITGSILGRRSEIGNESVLQDCEVENNMRVEAKTEAKGEKFKSAQGLEATDEEMQAASTDHPLVLEQVNRD